MLKRKRTTTASKKATKYRKRYKKESLSVYSNNRLHFVKRHVDYFTFALSKTTVTGNGWVFRLNNVPGYTEFTNMYDQYKICGVYMKFYPSQTQNATAASLDNSAANARFFSAIDYTDAVAPASTDVIREFENCEVTSILDVHEKYKKNPKFINSTGQVVSDFVETTNASLNWYGLRTAQDATSATGSATALTYSVECVYYLCFKNIK